VIEAEAVSAAGSTQNIKDKYPLREAEKKKEKSRLDNRAAFLLAQL